MLKPVIFLGPVFWWVFEREKNSFKSLGITSKGLKKALFFGLGLGVLFALVAMVAHIAKYGQFSPAGFEGNRLSFLMLTFITSISEAILFFGFFLVRLKALWANEVKVIVVNTLLFSLIHLPIMLFVYHYNFPEIFSYLFLIFCVGFGNSVIMLRTQNLLAPILSQTFWGMSIYLFR